GNTWDKLSDISLTNVSKGVGVGIRLNLPMIGMLGFDFGWGVDYANDDPYGKDKVQFEPHIMMNRGF
ncbi:MAG: hypothetical protein ACM31E_01715, partial [Fibrobacterota bacterium]|nr:hypothetical protein [Chitinispirillaceae bacterium]